MYTIICHILHIKYLLFFENTIGLRLWKLFRNSKYKHILYTYSGTDRYISRHREAHLPVWSVCYIRAKIDWSELGPSLNSAVWCCVLLVLVESCSRAKDRRAGNFLVTRHALKKVCFSSRVSDRFLACSASRGIDGIRCNGACTRLRARLSAIFRTLNDHRFYIRKRARETHEFSNIYPEYDNPYNRQLANYINIRTHYTKGIFTHTHNHCYYHHSSFPIPLCSVKNERSILNRTRDPSDLFRCAFFTKLATSNIVRWVSVGLKLGVFVCQLLLRELDGVLFIYVSILRQ